MLVNNTQRARQLFFWTYSIGWLLPLFLLSHGPIERHIKFNSQSSQYNILRITESEFASDSSHCHANFWPLFTPEHVFTTTANLWQLLSCQWATPCLWCMGPTPVARGQREVRESRPLNVQLSFPNIYRCGDGFYSKKKPQVPRRGEPAQLSRGRNTHRGTLLCCVDF